MKLANDPRRDYKRLVIDGYDRCAAAFNAERATEAAEALAPLMSRLPAGARVLDLGCGAGVPVARTLAERFDVIGADISASQLAFARRQAPGVALIRADMEHLHFVPATFDAVVSFYAIFHIRRREQPALFARILDWLRPGGYLLASLGTTNIPSYTEQDFFGVEMYWSHYGTAQYREMLIDAGFELIGEQTLHHGYRDDGAPEEVHPLFFARKPSLTHARIRSYEGRGVPSPGERRSSTVDEHE
jgi:cyclopropane fatty-acyl-phospholipid synthase-like methyltransferase